MTEQNYNCGPMDGINYGAPGAQAYIDSWAAEFASQGIDYLKLDGVGTWDIPDIRAWSAALRRTGRTIILELSNSLAISDAALWPTLADGWRTGDDIECYTCEKNGSSFPLTDWAHVASRCDAVASWQPHGGPSGWNDEDSVEIGNGAPDGLTAPERRAVLALWSLVGAGIAGQADRTANQQRNEAVSSQLAAESEAFDTSDPSMASLLAAAAWSIAPTAEYRSSAVSRQRTDLKPAQGRRFIDPLSDPLFWDAGGTGHPDGGPHRPLTVYCCRPPGPRSRWARCPSAAVS